MTENKPIMIDGVRFNKWGGLFIDYDLNGRYKSITSSDKCYKILKSLIEQLIRKMRECEELKKNFNIEHAELLNARSKIEELKKQIESSKGLITNAGKQNYQLVQEYGMLKAENDKYSLFIEKLCDYAGLECDNEEQAIRTLLDFASQMYKAKEINYQLKTTNEQAEQKLERIRDIIGDSRIYREEDYGLDNITRELIQIIDEVE